MKEKARAAMTLLIICLIVAIGPQLGFIKDADFAVLISLLGIFGSIISFFFTLVVIVNE